MGKIENIEERNKRVENDKAWELSWTRRICIAAMIYFVAYVFLSRLGSPDAWLDAALATGAFVLSTLSLPIVKKFWIKKYGQ